MESNIFFYKKSGGEQWELTTDTAEFADPANVIFYNNTKKREKINNKKVILITYFCGTFNLVCIGVTPLLSPTGYFSSSSSVMFSRTAISVSPLTATSKCVPALK